MKYKSVRGTYRRMSRARKPGLPSSIVFFCIFIIALSAFYLVSHSQWRSTSHDPTQLDLKTSVRSGYGNLCTKSGSIFAKKSSLAFLIPGIIFCFVGLAIVTDDYFVSALELICERFDLSEDVAGATFMAAGSSAPEFFASLIGVFRTKDGVGVGTIVGSAVFNLLVIIGLSAALAGAVLKLDWRPLMRDSTFYIISIILLLVFTIAPYEDSKGRIEWWEGLTLVLTYVVYVLFMAYLNKPYMAWAAKLIKSKDSEEQVRDIERGEGNEADIADESPTSDTSTPAPTLGMRSSTDKQRYRDLNPRTRLKVAQYAVIAAQRLVSSSSDNSDTGADDDRMHEQHNEEVAAPRTWSPLKIPLPSSFFGWLIFPLSLPWNVLFGLTIIDCSVERLKKYYPVTFVMSIVWISGISYLMVEAARISGCLIGIPANAMGLTVLAAGTSVPDALASVSVAREGAGNMAVSNAIGSNVFDILLGLGLPWFLGDLILDEGIYIRVEPLTRVVVPIIILFAIMIVFLVTVILFRWKMRPKLGYLLVGMYFAFVLYTLLDVFVFKISNPDD